MFSWGGDEGGSPGEGALGGDHRVTGKPREAASALPLPGGFRGGPGPNNNPRHPGAGGGRGEGCEAIPRRTPAGCRSRPFFGGRSTWPWGCARALAGRVGCGAVGAGRAGCFTGGVRGRMWRVKKKEKSKQREAALRLGVLRAPSDAASGFARPRPRAAVRARPRAGPP